MAQQKINNLLRKSHNFASKEETPEWVRLWKWVEEDEEDLKELLKNVDSQLKRNEITVPGQLLQIFGAKAFLQKFGGIEGTIDELASEFILIIERLSKKHLLPAPKLKSAFEGGYSIAQA